MKGITADHRIGAVSPSRQAVAVDKNMLWLDAKRFDRACHGQHRRLQDINVVDFRNARHTDPDNASRKNKDFKFVPPLGRQCLAVVNTIDPAFAKDDGGCNNRPGKRPPSGLINASDQTIVSRRAA